MWVGLGICPTGSISEKYQITIDLINVLFWRSSIVIPFMQRCCSDRCNIGYMGVISESVGAITLLVCVYEGIREMWRSIFWVDIGWISQGVYILVVWLWSTVAGGWLHRLHMFRSERLLFWGYWWESGAWCYCSTLSGCVTACGCYCDQLKIPPLPAARLLYASLCTRHMVDRHTQ